MNRYDKMNSRRTAQKAAKSKRRTTRALKQKEETREMAIAQARRGMGGFTQVHAQFGLKQWASGNPIFSPRRGKLKGYMRA